MACLLKVPKQILHRGTVHAAAKKSDEEEGGGGVSGTAQPELIPSTGSTVGMTAGLCAYPVTTACFHQVCWHQAASWLTAQRSWYLNRCLDQWLEAS